MPQRPTDDAPQGEQGWATISEAADTLGVGIEVVRSLADSGKLPCWRPTPTSYRRFDRAVLREYRQQAAAARVPA